MFFNLRYTFPRLMRNYIVRNLSSYNQEKDDKYRYMRDGNLFRRMEQISTILKNRYKTDFQNSSSMDVYYNHLKTEKDIIQTYFKSKIYK